MIYPVMRILALADLHDRWERLEGLSGIEADLLALCGDIHNGSDASAARPILDALSRLSMPCLAVPGNMDQPQLVEGIWPGNGLQLVHRCCALIGEAAFYGMGGMVPRDRSRVGDPNRYYHTDEDVFQTLCSLDSAAAVSRWRVVLAHQPPRGVQDRLYNGEESGSVGLLRFILDRKPALVLCGHIHEDRGACRLGKTCVVNVGEFRRGHFALVDLGDRGISVEWLDV
ncbi:MAG TPA: metallophosphoesterase [Methanotrichaceae archaeon]|nr:metallophosphoesterase [Methanotrichaceae archaeon]HQJ27851.1 metallophosphoesterase [Methanotrichaceae archaeon]